MRTRPGRSRALRLCALLALTLSPVDPSARGNGEGHGVEAIRDAAGREVGHVQSDRLTEFQSPAVNESSGLAVSRTQPGVFWTHNDSGDAPRLYAFDERGNALGICDLAGTDAYDWEDMASVEIRGRPYLLAGDVGDNKRERSFCKLYLIAEPVVGEGSGPFHRRVEDAETIYYAYEDGPQNCEAVGATLDVEEIFLITKEGKKPCGVYRLRRGISTADKPIVATRIATLDIQNVTGMDISHDGRRAVLLTYDDAYEFIRPPDRTWEDVFSKESPRTIPMPWRMLGESICYGLDDKSFYLTSESSACPLWIVRILDEQP